MTSSVVVALRLQETLSTTLSNLLVVSLTASRIHIVVVIAAEVLVPLEKRTPASRRRTAWIGTCRASLAGEGGGAEPEARDGEVRSVVGEVRRGDEMIGTAAEVGREAVLRRRERGRERRRKN